MAMAETKRTLNQLSHLAPEDRAAIEKMARATINKVLHEPTRYLKSNGCQGDRAISLDIARKLFGLDNEPLNEEPQNKQ